MPPLQLELLPSTSSPSGVPRLRIKPAELQYQPYTLQVDRPAQATQPTTRLHEIITRIGEICLSPELAHVMLFPSHAISYAKELTTPLDFPESYHELCRAPRNVLHAMSDIASAQRAPAQSAQFLAMFTEACLPPPTSVTLRQPLHLCAWKIESPTRVLLYTGQSESAQPCPADLALFTPHTLSKVLLDERSKRPVPSAVHLLGIDQEFTPNAIRSSLLHSMQSEPPPHRERITVVQSHQHDPRHSSGRQSSARFSSRRPATGTQHSSVLDHTLEEAAAVFVHPPSRNHSDIGLNQSPPWDKDHIDSRSGILIHSSIHPPLELCIITYI